jgi:hypothetical protein
VHATLEEQMVHSEEEQAVRIEEDLGHASL